VQAPPRAAPRPAAAARAAAARAAAFPGQPPGAGQAVPRLRLVPLVQPPRSGALPRNDMDVASMSLSRHECGIHVVPGSQSG